jgi:hypothetical protein
MSNTTPPSSSDRPMGRPPSLDEYARGKLVMALACGMTQREAAAWARAGQSSVSRLMRQPEFAADLRRCTEFARLHPLLRMYQAAGESWKVAARLIEHQDERFGPLTTDDLVAGMSAMLEQVNASRHAPGDSQSS